MLIPIPGAIGRVFYPIMMAVTGHDDREKINAWLMYRYVLSYEPLNFKGFLDDFPLTVEYGKKADDLRRRYRAEPWDAIFEDRLGAEVSDDGGKPHRDYTVFRQAESGRRAVVIVNHHPEKDLKAGVTIEGCRGNLFAGSPEEPDARGVQGDVLVPARSVVVVFER
jgi:hypothetical protein